MNVRKSVAGCACSVALAASLGAFAGTALAADFDYAPDPLGNDSYTNQTDQRNDVTVQGMEYTSQIANQNSDEVSQAESASVTLGQKSDDAVPILLTNETGKNITALSVRGNSDSSYPANMLSGNLANGESAGWYFTYDYNAETYTNHIGHDYLIPENFCIQATFDDGTTGEFHNVNMNGVRTVALEYSNDYGVYYVERTTITNHTPDPNLYYEANLQEYGNDAEFNFHVNSAAALDQRAVTATRGSHWILGAPENQSDLQIYAISLPLYGQPSADYTDGLYKDLYWNSDDLTWRAFDFENGFDI